MCGTRFIIPSLQGAPAVEPEPEVGPGPSFPDFTASSPPAETPSFEPEPREPPEPRLLHIPCPNGHELETPEEMLGQDVLCPLCGEQFNLQFKNSVEHQQEKERQREQREQQFEQVWLKRAIIAAVVVVLGLVVMVVVTLNS